MLDLKEKYITSEEQLIATKAKKLDIENDSQYFLFREFLRLGITRDIAQLSRETFKPTKLLYAYAIKFDWLERAAEYDKQEIEYYNHIQSIEREQLRLEKKEVLNRIQERANRIVKNYFYGEVGANIRNQDYSRVVQSDDTESYDIKLRRNKLSLSIFDLYLKISSNLDKQYKELENIEINYKNLDHKVVEMKEYFEEYLKVMEEYSQQEHEQSSITEEMDYVEKEVARLQNIA